MSSVCKVFFCLTAGFQLAVSFTSNVRTFDIKLKARNPFHATLDDSVQVEQWDKFVEHHVGAWCGIQSTHYHQDEESSSATEKILCGTLLTLNDQSIEHSNFYISDEIDFISDDARISSDRIVKQSIATYLKPSLASKVCGNVAMGGPGMSREGLSLQFSFSHEGCRMRLLVAYEPSDFVSVPSTSIQIPSSMSMSDITISREKQLDKSEDTSASFTLPAAKTFTRAVPHYLWRTTSMDADFGGQYIGVKDTYQKPETSVTDKIKTEEIPLGALPFYEEFEENFQSALLSDDIIKGVDDDDEDDMEFVKLYDGGLLIQAPLVILAGEETDIKVHWSVPNKVGSSTARTVYIASATFTAMNDAVNKTRRKRRGDTFIDQPLLLSYTVETLKKE